MNRLNKIAYWLTMIGVCFAASCRINEAATDAVNAPNRSAIASPTEQPTASPARGETVGVAAEKKLQENFAEKIPNAGRTLEDFVPPGGALVTKAAGDLNADGKEDGALIVLKKTSEVFDLAGKITDSEQYKQFLIIVARGADGELKFQTSSSTALFPLNSDNAENSTAELKISDGKILLNQIRALNDTMLVYENSLEKLDGVWQVSAGKMQRETPQKKIYRGGLRKIDVFEARQKTPVPLKDFDVEKVAWQPERKISTY